MTKERSAKIVTSITVGAGVLIPRRGYMSHYSEYALSCTLSIYITLIAIVLMLLSYPKFDFHSFYDVAADMQIRALLSKS